MAEWQVLGKQHRKFNKLVRHSRRRCLVGHLLSSCARLDFALLFSKYSLTLIALPYPKSRESVLIPSMMGFLRFALVCGMLESVNTGRGLKYARAVW